MSSFFSTSSRKNIIVFIVLFFISLSLMLASKSKFVLAGKEFQELIFYPFRTLSRGVGKLFSLNSNKEEEDLKIGIEKYKALIINNQKELASMINYKKENEELRKLLDLREQIEYHSIIADVIGVDLNFNYSYITINKGRIDGVSKNDPVITFYKNNKVAVGLISESSVFTSKVKTIESEGFAIGVTLEDSEINGVIEGMDSKENLTRLLYISKSVNLQVGQRVYSSPQSGLFPPYILVGVIASIDTTNKTIMSHQSFVKPYVDLRQVSQVFILKQNTEKKK